MALRLAHNNAADSDDSETEEISLADVKKFGAMFWLLTFSCLVVYGCVLPFNNVAAGILSERNYFKDPNSACVLAYSDQCSSGSLLPQDFTPNTPVIPPPDGGAPTACDTTSSIYAPVLPESLSYTNAAVLKELGADESR